MVPVKVVDYSTIVAYIDGPLRFPPESTPSFTVVSPNPRYNRLFISAGRVEYDQGDIIFEGVRPVLLYDENESKEWPETILDFSIPELSHLLPPEPPLHGPLRIPPLGAGSNTDPVGPVAVATWIDSYTSYEGDVRWRIASAKAKWNPKTRQIEVTMRIGAKGKRAYVGSIGYNVSFRAVMESDSLDEL